MQHADDHQTSYDTQCTSNGAPLAIRLALDVEHRVATGRAAFKRELFAGLQSLADDPDLQEDAFSDFSYENESVIAKSGSRLFLEDDECDARGFWYLCHDQADVLISSRGISFVAYSSDDGEEISHEAPLEKAHSTVYDCLLGACFEEVDGFQQSMVLLRSKNCPPY